MLRRLSLNFFADLLLVELSVTRDFYPHEIVRLHIVVALHWPCFGRPRDLDWLTFQGDEEGSCNPMRIGWADCDPKCHLDPLGPLA